MVRDCPLCGLVNPPTAVHCDCGYDFYAKEVDRSRAPKPGEPVGVESLRLSYGAARGFVGLLVGIGILAVAMQNESLIGLVAGFAVLVTGVGQLVYHLLRAN
jgi:hypothetical protein